MGGLVLLGTFLGWKRKFHGCLFLGSDWLLVRVHLPIYKYIKGAKSCSVFGLQCCGKGRKGGWGGGQTGLVLRIDEEGAAGLRGLCRIAI